MDFKLIIGLGNPDMKYQNTYHNVGFLFIDYLEKYQVSSIKYQAIKSDAYMNQSGTFVRKALKKAGVKPEELLIVHDDSDLELGKYKLSFGRGAAGHHGIENIMATLKSKNFWRLRIGIRPLPAKALATAGRPKAGTFVLKKILPAHKKLLNEVFEKAASEL